MLLGSKDRQKSIRVVLVDDQAEVRTALIRHLTRHGGFDIVGEAEDGEEAVRLVTDTKPDAVVLDLAMPTMDGLQATREIARCSPETKVVILSSVADFGGTREDALSLGADAVFEKYTHPRTLIKGIARVVGNRPSASPPIPSE